MALTSVTNNPSSSAAAAAASAATSRVKAEEDTPPSCTALIERLTEKAQDNDVEAMLELGNTYSDGIINGSRDRLLIDHAKAIEWWTQAAEQGNIEAMFKLADAYDSGALTGNRAYPRLRQPQQVIAWLTKAAEAGDIGAMLKLAHEYSGQEQNDYLIHPRQINYTKRIEWLTKAADQGNITAMIHLGNAYHDGKVSDRRIHYQKTIEWWTQAADAGDLSAMIALGRLYDEGKVTGNRADITQKNPTQAVAWWTKAVEKESTEAMCCLGEHYSRYALSTSKENIRLAVKWLTKAAEAGDPEAIRLLKLDRFDHDPNIFSRLDLEMLQAYYYRKYDAANGSYKISRLDSLAKPCQDYHKSCFNVPNFMAEGQLDTINDEWRLHRIIEGLCQYEDNRLTSQADRFAMLREIIAKDDKYLTYMMTVMPVQEKDLFQQSIIPMSAEEINLKNKVIASIVDDPAPELQAGSVHQSMPAIAYLLLVTKYKMERAEAICAQGKRAANGNAEIIQVQNAMLRRVLKACLQSVGDTLYVNSKDRSLLTIQGEIMEKIRILKAPEAAPLVPRIDLKRPREDADPPASAASAANAAADSNKSGRHA